MPRKYKSKLHGVRWENIDWARSNDAIADDLACRADTIGKKRKIYAPDTVAARRGVVTVDWSSIDWSLPVKQIAKQTKVTTGWVYAMKKIHSGSNININKKYHYCPSCGVKIFTKDSHYLFCSDDHKKWWEENIYTE